MLRKFLPILLIFAGFHANATIISGSHFTDAGKAVDLQGLEWMSLEQTRGLSRTDVEDGFTDYDGNVWAAGDWQYATRAQTANLLGSLWGGVYSGWSADNADGAMWFVYTFFGTEYGNAVTSDGDGRHTDERWTSLDASLFLYGGTGECDSTASCWGQVSNAESHYRDILNTPVGTSEPNTSYHAESEQELGKFQWNWGLSATQNEVENINVGTAHPSFGSLLVRSARVQEPAVIALFATGLFGIGFARRRRS